MDPVKTHSNTVSETELKEWLRSIGQPEYRCAQIRGWIFKDFAISPDEMKNVPAELRRKLVEKFTFCRTHEIKSDKSADGTEKLLLKLHDAECVESVIIPSPERFTFCLSSQVGCPVGCYFCASGVGGLIRNLDVSEILDELFICCRKIGGTPDNIVFMGTGEPLMNYSNLVAALNIIGSAGYMGISPRRITVSTSGFVPGIIRLADEKKPWNLAVSIHAPTDKLRATLIPLKHRYPVKDICDACKYYFSNTGRIVTFEYTLVKDVNDSPSHALELATIAHACGAKVNLIPLNPVENSSFFRPEKQIVSKFESILRSKKIPVTVRVEKGDNINAACGQLRVSHHGKQAVAVKDLMENHRGAVAVRAATNFASTEHPEKHKPRNTLITRKNTVKGKNNER
jgi:23S rRNA (adenine2503-C2)-methyltransferase